MAAIAATTLSVALAGTSLVQSASGAPRTHAHKASFTPQPITWSDCTLAGVNAQCGFLTVPMDYAHPHGKMIKLAVSRRVHTTTRYQGVMLVNPGGPGGAGRVYAVLPDLFGIPHNAGDSYDWIGFDPRGVGESKPSLSCNANFFHGDRPPYRPTNHKIMARWVTRSKAYAAACAQRKNHALFNHVTTRDSVRDMESLRKALGQQKLNFYGFSYGTYLGSVYMTLHPDRVRRFILDSTVDPRHVFYQSNLDQDVAFQKTFDIYFKWLAKYHSVYHVGSTHAAVRKLFLATQAKLDKHAAHGFLGGDELLDVFTSAGYYVYGWEDIAAAYSKYINHGDPSDLIQMYKDANDTSPGGDNGYTMYLATQCTDAHWPQSQAFLNKDSWRLDRNYDYFTWANAWFNGPCAYWHFKNGNPVDVTGKHVHVPVLMIDETYDPATPYEGSLYVRKIFPTASLIEGKNGTTHAGSLSGVACTDDAIARYLSHGTVPPRQAGNHSDKVCRPVPKPNPTATAPNTVASPDLRAQISRGLVH